MLKDEPEHYEIGVAWIKLPAVTTTFFWVRQCEQAVLLAKEQFAVVDGPAILLEFEACPFGIQRDKNSIIWRTFPIKPVVTADDELINKVRLNDNGIAHEHGSRGLHVGAATSGMSLQRQHKWSRRSFLQ
jgi:hypothetical protein